jgi:Uma2 family endonuclease
MYPMLAETSRMKFRFPPESPLRFYADDVGVEAFIELCRENPEWRMERAADGQMIIMAPTGSETGNFNSEILVEVGLWNRQQQLGKVFDSSTGFLLPNGAFRSPDQAWIANERWNALSVEEKRSFAPIAPDFVVELLSVSQSLEELRAKMDEYLACGCRLGWLIEPEKRVTYVYREVGVFQVVSFAENLMGFEVMPGLEVSLEEVWKR